MRALALLIAILALASCQAADRTNHDTGITLTYNGSFHQRPDAQGKPRDQVLLFTLHNNTDKPIWFGGFNLTTPLYEIHQTNGPDPGLVDSAFSATGSRRIPLAPRQSTAFAFQRHFDQAGQYLLQIGIGTIDRPNIFTLKSNPFTLKAHPDALEETE